MKFANIKYPQLELFTELDREIEFLRGRVKFGGCEYNAPFPSMVVVFGKRKGGDE